MVDKKFIIAGLDNSGKSSIVHSLMGSQNLLSIFAMQPTVGVNRELITLGENNFNILDFGGQEVYRKEHIDKNLKENLDSTDKLIYVIDVQDVERHDVSLNYLQQILNLIDGKLQPEISIFIHKSDPDVENQYQEIFESLVANIKDLMPEGIQYKIFKTTIFTVFQKTPVFL